MPPHSATVRGTLSNPKTAAAKQSSKSPPQLGDHVSLSSEKSDSVPLDSIKDSSYSRPADPYRENEHKHASSYGSSGNGNGSGSLPHSKKVRGTLGNDAGPSVNNSMLGDPVSLKAETSQSEFDKGAAGGDQGMEDAAKRRGEYEGKRGSKL